MRSCSRHPAKTSLSSFRLSSLSVGASSWQAANEFAVTRWKSRAAARFSLFSPGRLFWWTALFCYCLVIPLLFCALPRAFACITRPTLSFFASRQVPRAAAAINEFGWLRIPRGKGRRNKDELVLPHYLSSNNKKPKYKSQNPSWNIRSATSYCTRSNNLQDLRCCLKYFPFRLLMAVTRVYSWFFVTVDEKHQQGQNQKGRFMRWIDPA